jgi:hypothetical protein
MKEIERRSDEVVVSLTHDDLDMIIAGLRETLQEVEDWEFDTRTGFQREEIRQFLDEVLTLVSKET